MTPEKQEILDRFRSWALKNDDVICVLCAGSHGNQVSGVSDEFSDIDVVMFTRRIQFYLTNAEWAPQALGPVAFEYLDNIEVPGVPGVKKLFFENGVRLDILFWKAYVLTTAYRYLKLAPVGKFLPAIVRKMIENSFSYFPRYIRRGFEIIADKQNLAHKARFITANRPYRPEPFSEKKLQGIVGRFWMNAFLMATYINRKELFTAKAMSDRIMKQLLQQLIELYTRKAKGPGYDIWQDGRHLEDWAPQFITRRLQSIYGLYDAEDAWRSMMETIELFSLIVSRLTTEFPDIKLVNPEKHFRKMIKAVEAGTMKAMLM